MAKRETIEEVRRAWEEALGVEISEEDARQIIENVARMFDVFSRLDKKRKDRENAESGGE